MFVLRSTRPRLLSWLCALALGLYVGSGCGFERLHATLPAAIPGFTFADLKLIQDDTTLTTDEKRERIREAINAPDDDDGDRLVEFLLNFELP